MQRVLTKYSLWRNWAHSVIKKSRWSCVATSLHPGPLRTSSTTQSPNWATLGTGVSFGVLRNPSSLANWCNAFWWAIFQVRTCSQHLAFLFHYSPGFLRFVRVLCGMCSDERKAFLQFTTGCSTLPPGGLANLHPRLTIVRKVWQWKFFFFFFFHVINVLNRLYWLLQSYSSNVLNSTCRWMRLMPATPQ